MIEIYQGGNTPIVIEIEDDPIPKFNDISASLYMERLGELKHWMMEDVEFYEEKIILPLSQEDTLRLPEGTAVLSLKALGEEDNVITYNELAVKIMYKFDKTLMNGGDGDEGTGSE